MGWLYIVLGVLVLLGIGAFYDVRRRGQLRNHFVSDQERRDFQYEKPVGPPPADMSSGGI